MGKCQKQDPRRQEIATKELATSKPVSTLAGIKLKNVYAIATGSTHTRLEATLRRALMCPWLSQRAIPLLNCQVRPHPSWL